MPCFKGLAVSIHTPDGPLPEHHIQKQSRFSRINAYIAVPPPKVSPETHKPEQSNFAISITLLTPGMNVPYSTPKPTREEPYPRPQIVGGFQGFGRERVLSNIGPYEPLTSSYNETVAAYIYFDGRRKEEVATLLRRGEETWVNSRWVSIPQSEGGGLAEREFLFREVGLERWLNGLDLEGKDAAATIEKRRRKIERRKIKKEARENGSDEDDPISWRRQHRNKPVLRYGENALEKVSDEDDADTSSEESDDDPMPEAAGQIKVALFRVLASGEVKKGEYEAQFGADEDDDNNTNGNDGDVDHTTSFAKPKTLDPKSISTQTVTGIDPSDRPYATFTFFYRGDKTLRKMGYMKQKEAASSTADSEAAKSKTAKRASIQADIAKLKPLKPGGALGFTGIRDGNSPSSRKNKDEDDMDSDDEEETAVGANSKAVEADEDVGATSLSLEDAKKQGEIADGVEKIQLKPRKRSHSLSPERQAKDPSSQMSRTFSDLAEEKNDINFTDSTAPHLTSEVFGAHASPSLPDPSMIGSPMKKARPSSSGIESELRRTTAEQLARGLGFGFSDTPARTETASASADSFGAPLQPSTKSDPLSSQTGKAEDQTVKEDLEL